MKPDELRGASMTLTNPGGLGTVASVPRLMPGPGHDRRHRLDRATRRASAARTRTRCAALGVEKVMTMTSTYDHRVIQGAESGAFLGEIDRLLARRRRLLRGRAREPRPVARRRHPGRAAPPARSRSPAPRRPRRAASRRVGDAELLAGVAAAMSLVKAHRSHGHLAAQLDPLGAPPPGDPALTPRPGQPHARGDGAHPGSILRIKVPGETFAAALPHLREAYCGTIAYEIEHLSDHQKRLWLRGVIESGRFREPIAAERRVAILERLVEVDAFERFLRRTYLGQKTFSIEGVDALVPITDHVIELSAAEGTGRGRDGHGPPRPAGLHHPRRRAGRPSRSWPSSRATWRSSRARRTTRETAGDVKYHLGAEGTYITRSGRPVTVKLAANPSHLEQVNAVAEGHTRALPDLPHRRASRATTRRAPCRCSSTATPPSPARASWPRRSTCRRCAATRTGGTVHVIANNQIGFTTDPYDSRSTYHVSDLARGFDIPVIHVNADDIDACIIGRPDRGGLPRSATSATS